MYGIRLWLLVPSINPVDTDVIELEDLDAMVEVLEDITEDIGDITNHARL